MQQLIKGKGKAKTGLRQIDHRVKQRLGQSKQRDPCEQCHRQGMGQRQNVTLRQGVMPVRP